MLKKYIYICSKWKANVLLFRKKLFKSLFVHASIYPVLVTYKNCNIILQSCNYKKPSIHPCLVFVLFKFFCWGRGGFKMEFCSNLTLLRQEKEEGCDLTEKSEQKHLSYRCTHVKVSSQCQQTFTVTKWQTQSWFHEQLTLFISAINSKKKTTDADISSADNNSAKCLFFSTFR